MTDKEECILSFDICPPRLQGSRYARKGIKTKSPRPQSTLATFKSLVQSVAFWLSEETKNTMLDVITELREEDILTELQT